MLKGLQNDTIRRKLILWKTKREVDKMLDGKKWYTSKTFWVAVIATALAGTEGISGSLGHPIVIPSYVYRILEGLGLWSVRDGIGKQIV